MKYFKSNKKLGQNFLKNKNISKLIIKTINPLKKELIIEIGPGYGALTKYILKISNFVYVIEIDSKLSYILNSNFKKKIKIFNLDILKFNFYLIYKKKKKLLKIIGNIPYNISIPIIFYLLKYINIIKDINLMFQKEVADKLISKKNNKSYSKLTLIVKYFFKVYKLIDVSSKEFTPIPKINSTLIKFIPRFIIKYPVFDVNKLYKIINLAFNKRRKTIKNSLKNFINKKQLIKQGINPMFRAENLNLKSYCKLTNFLIKNNKI